MIKIRDKNEIQVERITYDLYTPMNIEFGQCSTIKEPTIYWRTGNFKNSLLEVGIGKYGGEIRSITLVICDKVIYREYVSMQDYKIDNGCPTYSIRSKDNETYIDEEAEITVYIGADTVFLFFSDNKVTSCIKNNNTYFFMDTNKKWVGFGVDDVTNEDMEILTEALS